MNCFTVYLNTIKMRFYPLWTLHHKIKHKKSLLTYIKLFLFFFPFGVDRNLYLFRYIVLIALTMNSDLIHTAEFSVKLKEFPPHKSLRGAIELFKANGHGWLN